MIQRLAGGRGENARGLPSTHDTAQHAAPKRSELRQIANKLGAGVMCDAPGGRPTVRAGIEEVLRPYVLVALVSRSCFYPQRVSEVQAGPPVTKLAVPRSCQPWNSVLLLV